ncbi:MAG: hypothetical protein ABS76_11195 [Pelagibacterium sp. SCN 64-44]|nr:MAG: hypothetical protein ABS76_11195 [Pelagibacterium sp. SCN 64-44]
MTKPLAFITGGSRGIGLEAARDLLGRGWSVAISARSTAALVAAEQDLASPDVFAIECDVADRLSMQQAVERAEAALGPVAALVNNAGVIDPVAEIADADPQAWMDLLDINVGGIFNACQAVLPGMVERGRGVIVNMSSGAAHRPVPGWSAYCASKAAVAMFTQSLHAEYGARGVRVHGFVPGAVRTSMLMGARASYDNDIARLDADDLLPPELPARCIGWIVAQGPADMGGTELSIRDPELRQRVGLEERSKW